VADGDALRPPDGPELHQRVGVQTRDREVWPASGTGHPATATVAKAGKGNRR